MTSSEEIDRNPAFAPLKLPWNWRPEMIDDENPGLTLITRDVNVADIMLNTIVTQSFISDEILSARDEGAALSFEEKCAKYLGLDDEEIKRMKKLIKKDNEDVDD